MKVARHQWRGKAGRAGWACLLFAALQAATAQTTSPTTESSPASAAVGRNAIAPTTAPSDAQGLTCSPQIVARLLGIDSLPPINRQDPPPSNWIAHLADDRWQDRDRAEDQLVRWGPDVFPSLQQTLLSSDNPELKHRLQCIARRISRYPLQPTYLSLHLDHVSPREAIAAISQQAGLPLAAEHANLWQRVTTPVTYECTHRPLMEVLLAVCAQAHLAIHRDPNDGRGLIFAPGDMTGAQAIGAVLVLRPVVANERFEVDPTLVELRFAVIAEPNARVFDYPLKGWTPLDATDAAGRAVTLDPPEYRDAAPLGYYVVATLHRSDPSSRLARLRVSIPLLVATDVAQFDFDAQGADHQSRIIKGIRVSISRERSAVADDWDGTLEIEGIKRSDDQDQDDGLPRPYCKMIDDQGLPLNYSIAGDNQHAPERDHLEFSRGTDPKRGMPRTLRVVIPLAVKQTSTTVSWDDLNL